ncbi:hypothetical protein GCM10010517_63790 [Streptosporangium fragile]|uniref:Uncharacterized protein n=1 Tax=Streptosporangium fragile TaxID=46186 RepID=A0ABN3W7M6_9ACTN
MLIAELISEPVKIQASASGEAARSRWMSGSAGERVISIVWRAPMNNTGALMMPNPDLDMVLPFGVG